MTYPMFKVFVDVEESLKNVKEVLESGYVAEGTWAKKFENKLNEFLETTNGVLLNSCTSALTMALRLAGVGPGDEVITTSMTCLATNTPILDVGAKPVWADIDYHTGMIDPYEVEKKINSKTKVIMFVNWAGIPADLKKLYEISRNNNILLIQDAAHSLGAKFDNQPIHYWSDFTCYSLQAIKHLTSIDGGLLVCKDPLYVKEAKNLRWFGIDREASKDEVGNWRGQAWGIDVPRGGFKYHMNNVLASIGLANIKNIGQIIKKHQMNASYYHEKFCGNKSIIPQQVINNEATLNSSSSYWIYTVLLDPSIDRDMIMSKMNEKGIGASLVHVPNHHYSCFKESYVDLPKTDFFSKHQLSLPVGWWLEKEDIYHIANVLIGEIVRACFGKD